MIEDQLYLKHETNIPILKEKKNINGYFQIFKLLNTFEINFLVYYAVK